MSVVVWDGRYLAADKRVSQGGVFLTTNKIHELASSAVCGMVWDSNAHRHALLQRLSGADVAAKDTEDAEAIVVKMPGEVVIWQGGAPICVTDKFCAIGAGRDFALAFLHAPEFLFCAGDRCIVETNAMQAVAFASKFVLSCGNGVTYWDSQTGTVQEWNGCV